MQLPQIKAQKKKGNEIFLFNDEVLDTDISDFWSWNQSNLIENRTRGILAEFIVKKALQINSDLRTEWDSYDLKTNKGIKLEIKSAAYIQSWEQYKYSEIKFGIKPTVGNSDSASYDGKKRRWADLYVFCLLKHKNQKTLNPLDLNQWIFYILETEELNNNVSEQKTIGLKSLLKLHPIECTYSQLKNAVEKEIKPLKQI